MKPILFSGPMVRAILSGQKTETRRPVKPQPGTAEDLEIAADLSKCPFGQPGDLLWVRETWGVCYYADSTDWYREKFKPEMWPDLEEEGYQFQYRADWQVEYDSDYWRPSIHMPRQAARIWLKIVEVGVGDLRAITAEEAIAEGLSWVGDGGAAWGIPGSWNDNPRESFRVLWDSIYPGPLSWESNPLVWHCRFKRVAEP